MSTCITWGDVAEYVAGVWAVLVAFGLMMAAIALWRSSRLPHR